MEAKLINRAVANELWVQLCAARGTCWLPVLTDSMVPLLQPGDQVQVSRIVAQEIRFGDIVVFGRGDDLTVHGSLRSGAPPMGSILSRMVTPDTHMV